MALWLDSIFVERWKENCRTCGNLAFRECVSWIHFNVWRDSIVGKVLCAKCSLRWKLYRWAYIVADIVLRRSRRVLSKSIISNRQTLTKCTFWCSFWIATVWNHFVFTKWNHLQSMWSALVQRMTLLLATLNLFPKNVSSPTVLYSM